MFMRCAAIATATYERERSLGAPSWHREVGRSMLLSVALLLSACSTSAFAPTLAVPARSRLPTRRALPVVASAKVLPAMYTAVGTALLVKATKAATQTDGLLLVTTGLLAIVNLGPVDSARLASAKRACKITPPAASGAAKRKRQAARQHGQSAPLAVPQLGSCVSSGRAWQPWLA